MLAIIDNFRPNLGDYLKLAKRRKSYDNSKAEKKRIVNSVTGIAEVPNIDRPEQDGELLRKRLLAKYSK